MAINYPTSIDSLNKPTATTDIAGHGSNHTDVANAIEALETKVGVNSSAVTGSLDYKVSATGSANPGHKHTLAYGAYDVTATATELNYVAGVTGPIQTAINARATVASPSFTGTVTMPTGLSGIAKLTSGVLSTATGPSGTIVGTTDTQTLSNKAIQKRVASTTSSATPAPNADTTDVFDLTAQAATAAFAVPTGTPVDSQTLIVRIKDNATARAITWASATGGYVAGGVALPSATVTGKYLHVGLMYVTSNSLNKWMCLSSVQEV